MTTLPQTTNARLPRPVSGGMQLAGPGGGGALATAQGGQQQGASDIWRVIRSNIWMILIVAGILAPVSGYFANAFLAKNYPRYTAAGFIQVQPPVAPSVVKFVDAAPADT